MFTYRLTHLLIFGVIAFQCLNAQTNDVLELADLKEMTENIESNQDRLEQISSPLKVARSTISGIYLDPEWQAATVFTKDGELLYCSARYNIHKNRMEIKWGNEIRSLFTERIKGIVINESLFISVSSGEEGMEGVKAYYEVLAAGQMTLLKKYKLELYNTGGTALHPSLGNQQEFRSSSELHYGKHGQTAFYLKKGKKNMEVLFGSEFGALETYAKENRLGFKKEKDLAALFDWYNKG